MANPIGFHEIPIDDILKNAYAKLEVAFTLGTKPTANPRENFPIVSELASPGSGKTYSIQTLAADQHILDSWWKENQSTSAGNLVAKQNFYEKMKNALRIIVAYNSFSDFKPYLDGDLSAQIGMCCRVLFRFALMVFFKTHLMKNKIVAMWIPQKT